MLHDLQREKEDFNKEIGVLKGTTTLLEEEHKKSKLEFNDIKENLLKEREAHALTKLEMSKMTDCEEELQHNLEEQKIHILDLENKPKQLKEDLETQICKLKVELKESVDRLEISSKNYVELEKKLSNAQEDLKNESAKVCDIKQVNETLLFQIKVLKEKLKGGDGDAAMDLELHDKLGNMIEDLKNERNLKETHKEELRRVTEENSTIINNNTILVGKINDLEEKLKLKMVIEDEHKQLTDELKKVRQDNEEMGKC